MFSNAFIILSSVCNGTGINYQTHTHTHTNAITLRTLWFYSQLFSQGLYGCGVPMIKYPG